MYHGILLITLLAQGRAARGGDSASREGARSGSKNALRDFSIRYMFIRYRKLISDGFQPPGVAAKIACQGRDVTFQMAEVAVSRQMFADILTLITRLRVPPASAVSRGASGVASDERRGMPRY